MLIWLLWTLLKGYQDRLYRRQAQAQIDRLQQQQTAHILPAIFAILKQAANTAYPEQRFGSLDVNRFIAFLQQSCDQPIFDQLPDNLDSLLYSNHSQIDQSLHDHLLTSASLWIAKHPQQVPTIC